MIWRLTMLLATVTSALAQDYLLPGDVKPRHYELRAAYDVDPASNFSLYAVVDILITVVKPTSKIVLHAQDFEVINENIKIQGPSIRKVTKVQLNETLNFLTLTLDDILQKDEEYILTIPFRGNSKAGLDGAYISTYVDTNTKKKEYLLTTQFEAIYARKAFPCFDEPLYKATFRLVLGHHRDFVAVSNMPIANSSSDNLLEQYWPWDEIKGTFKKELSEFVFDQFETSVPMSTYLVAYVISKFAYVDSPAGLSDTTFKIWARKDAINQTSYAAVTGPKVLSHFEKFFNVSFPLPKQDMFAIPDFSAGAMENWGLITYRETALLYDPEQSSFLNKERVAEVIAHELAHQWFGNLVTMKWWSDLWLNEGFATFVASVGVHAVEPTWHADKNYAVDNILSVFNLDALHSSHPVSVPLENPKRINEIFDEISYRKGSTLIRMMMMFLGEDVFRKALHNYLTKYSYKNAEQDDLWQELTQVAEQYGGLSRNVSVKTVMDTWTTQTGYPILNVERNYADKSVTVMQKRYLNLGAKSTTAVSWWVPLRVMCESEVGKKPDPVQWLAANEGVETEHMFDHGANANEWILFNHDMIALYRVNYDPRNWELLINTLTSDKMSNVPVLGRVQLLSDAFALAWNNQLEYSTALQLANYLQREDEFLPLSTGLRALGKIEGVFKRTPEFGAFQRFVRKLITEQYQKAGGLAIKKMINTDDLNSVKMQTMTSSWACRMKVPGCEENAIELFQSWMREEDPDVSNPIPLDLRRTVYCVGVSRGSVVEWRFLVARMRRANVASARDLLLGALSCTRDVWILAQYLEWTVTEGSEIRKQDAGRVISNIANSPVGFYVAREFVYTRLQDIYNAFGAQGRRMGIIIKSLLSQFTTERELDEFQIWYEKNKKYLEDAELAITQAIEAAKVNIEWLQRNKGVVVEKLRQFSA